MTLIFLSGPTRKTDRTVALSAADRPGELVPAPSGSRSYSVPIAAPSQVLAPPGTPRYAAAHGDQPGLLPRSHRAREDSRRARDPHPEDARDRRRREGEVGPPGRAARLRGDGLHALVEAPPLQSRGA